MKKVRIIFSPDAEIVYNYLNENVDNKNERIMLNAVHKKIDLIKSNIHYGNPIAKNIIPDEYKNME